MTTAKATLQQVRSTRRRSAHGVEFDILDDGWVLRKDGGSVSIYWDDVARLATAQLAMQTREAFAKIASIAPAITCKAYQIAFRSLLAAVSKRTATAVKYIDADDLAVWVGTQPGSAQVLQIKALFRMWRNLRGHGIDDEAFNLAERLYANKTNKSANVLTWDTDSGPYRPAEDEALRLALDDAFNEGIITLDKYVLFRILRGTGARISSIMDLKVEDLRQDNGRWFLRIPMQKQRRVVGWRVHFMPWKPISQGLAHIIRMHIDTNIKDRMRDGSDVGIAPLFPAPRAGNLSSADAHLSARKAQAAYNTVMKKLSVVSPITGRIITGHPHRDRHTYLTMLAMNGCTADEIAANAGHISTLSSEPYIHATIDHFQRMEKLVGAAFIPVADRFMGTVTTSEDDTRADDPIIDASASGVGSCQIGGCNAIESGVAPLACYTCRKFRAWADAPHANLMEKLMEEVDGLRTKGHTSVAETRIPIIIAIGDLLERIRQQTELGNG